MIERTEAGEKLRPENGDDIFLPNVWISTNYTVLQLRRPHAS
jgi:hypothetical protein